MQKQIKILLTILTLLILAVSCAKQNPYNNNNNNNNNNNLGQRGKYKLITDSEILKLPWSDPKKQEYFKTNWMNTFTNQTLLPAGVTQTTRKTDEKATYLENDNTVLGNFIYATNIEWKGTNWIGALYEDPRRAGQDSRWMLFHIDTDGNFMLASGFGTGAIQNAPTEENWKKIMSDYGSFQTGTIENFDYKK
ncbi:hypothetical protein [Brachyspira sp.]|uniref:hypothetical protein n=1 Tax=Brachyspira sp. TaxID=1977261 RepID=UPI00260B8849|nr:hypothetical protein [Brachyspira sp.]